MIMAVSMVVSHVVVVFIIVVFVWSSLLLLIAALCKTLSHMGLLLQRLSLSHQLFFKKVVLKTGDAIYFFRVETIKWLGSHCSLSAVIQECCPYKLVCSSAY